jgi:hypothetical protein
MSTVMLSLAARNGQTCMADVKRQPPGDCHPPATDRSHTHIGQFATDRLLYPSITCRDWEGDVWDGGNRGTRSFRPLVSRLGTAFQPVCT